MGKIARVSARRLAYDKMKAERSQYILTCNGENKNEMTESEINAFKHAVDKNNTSFFGLVKLRKLDLDTLFHHKSHCITLLQYASMKGRDNIVLNLLRAHANPVIRSKRVVFSAIKHNITRVVKKERDIIRVENEEMEVENLVKQIRYFISSLNLRYTAYLVNQIVDMRNAGNIYFASYSMTGEDKLKCNFCKTVIGSDEACIYDNCHRPSAEKHVVCEYCIWQVLLASDEMNDVEPLSNCPFCSDGDEANNISPYHRNNLLLHINKQLCEFQSLISTKQSTNKEAFLKLPIDKTYLRSTEMHFEGKESHKPRRRKKTKCEKNKRLSKKQLRKLLIGETQKKRAQTYFQAIETGNYLRLIHIIQKGIDINLIDENGETGLLHASFFLPPELNVALHNKNFGFINAYISRMLSSDAVASDKNYYNHTKQRAQKLLHRIYTVHILLNYGTSLNKRSHYGISFEDYLVPPLSRTMTDFNANENNVMIIENGEGIIVHDLLPAGSCSGSIRSNNDIRVPMNHPGKNLSYTVDNAFSEAFLSRLDNLFQSVPQENLDKRDLEKKSYTNTCARRKFFRERGTMWITRSIEQILLSLQKKILERRTCMVENDCNEGGKHKETNLSQKLPSHCLPRMRFLHYDTPGGKMEPHVDLSKSHTYNPGEINLEFQGKPKMLIQSTFTFILYLRDCNDGGETVFLERLGGNKNAEGILERAGKHGETIVQGENDRSSNKILMHVQPKRGRLLLFPHDAPHAGLPVGMEVPKLFLRGELF